MPTVQIAMADSAYAEMLRKALARDWAFRDWQVRCAERPDLEQKGVIVLDTKAFDQLTSCLPSPERIVLITARDPRQLSRAWDAGIASVVYEDASPGTVTLAILAARYRARRSRPQV